MHEWPKHFIQISLPKKKGFLLYESMHINKHSISPALGSRSIAMAADSSCSHWWHAPFYLATSFTLAFIAISTAKYPTAPPPPHHALALNASAALRLRGGFHITATLFQISPDLFFSGPQTTVFAIPDSAISSLSLPPPTMRRLLRYHAVPAALPMSELLKKPPGSCLQTLAAGENLAVTENDGAAISSLAINNVSISHPDLFLHGPLAVHGVAAPFETASSPPPCRVSNQSTLPPQIIGGDRAIEWRKVIRSLSSNGFVSFAIGLNAVLDGILRDYPNLGSATVFAPPNSEFLSSPSPFLDRIVRLHILQRSLSFVELSGEGNSSLRTLVPGSRLQISKASSSTLAINGVEISSPDLFTSNNFVVHGISRDFDFLEDFFSSFK